MSARPPDPDRDPGSALDALLADPVVWDEPTPGLEDRVVGAIMAEKAALDEDPPPITDLAGVRDGRPAARRSESRNPRMGQLVSFAAGIAAALVAVAVLAVPFGESAEFEVELAATDLAPADATAVALIDETERGTRLVVDFSGLPPAPEGTYYEAWLRQSPEVGVSAGTWHMRGGDGEIELWSAVSPQDYPLLTVTLQEEGGGPASSGQVVLRANLAE